MKMTIEEAISQLNWLREDRQSLCNGNPDDDEIWNADIEAIDVALKQMQENAELKRLLKLAVEDIKTMLTCECVSKICAEQACSCTTIGQCRSICKWKHADEAMKLIGEE